MGDDAGDKVLAHDDAAVSKVIHPIARDDVWRAPIGNNLWHLAGVPLTLADAYGIGAGWDGALRIFCSIADVEVVNVKTTVNGIGTLTKASYNDVHDIIR